MIRLLPARIAPLLLAPLFIPGAACASDLTDSGAARAACTRVAATMGERVITEDEIDRYIGRDAIVIKQKLYALRVAAINDMIERQLFRREAERRGVSETDLLRDLAKLTSRKIDEGELDRAYTDDFEALKALGEVGGRYRVLLDLEDRTKFETFRQALDGLKAAAGLQILLENPEALLDVRESSCLLGNPAARKRLTVFFDYECPFCRQFASLLSDFLASGGKERVSVAIKHLPLGQHRNAMDFAAAAVCAARQGAFPAFHSKLIAANHDSRDLVSLAGETGLDPRDFERCVVSPQVRKEVLLDVAEAHRNGVEATPALFLDGRAITTPQSAADLARAIGGEERTAPATGAAFGTASDVNKR